MNIGWTWYVLGLACAHAAAEKWRWPQAAESRRIDDKVHFIDQAAEDLGSDQIIQSDEAPFKEPSDTEGFYNQPPGSGRYPVKSKAYQQGVYPIRSWYKQDGYSSDGTLDSIEYCKCVSTPECTPRQNSQIACGPGKFLCCYKRTNRQGLGNSEVFNEVNDERPYILPAQENVQGAFSSHLHSDPIHIPKQSVLDGPQGATGNIGPLKRPVLAGPDGPTGTLGPTQKPLLVGPDGPSGIIGPRGQKKILIGPEGPTGVIGPKQKPVLVRPDGPTGVIGPVDQQDYQDRDVGPSGSAQRGVLVGPGGPTGMIGPFGRRPILVGPGGPTGIIGPAGRQRYFGNYNGYERQRNTGILIGSGGPTGTIGPGRGLLVGPGGPTGQIGPRGYSFFG